MQTPYIYTKEKNVPQNHDPRPISIDRNVSKTCVVFTGRCGASAEPDGKVVIRIRKAGNAVHLIEYPADIADGKACFAWGDTLYNLPAGRYIGDIFEDEQQVGSIQIELYPQGWQAEAVHDKPEPQSPWSCKGINC